MSTMDRRLARLELQQVLDYSAQLAAMSDAELNAWIDQADAELSPEERERKRAYLASLSDAELERQIEAGLARLRARAR